MSEETVATILREDKRRSGEMFATFNPVTGEGSVGERFCVEIADFPIPVQWLPTTMRTNDFVCRLIKARSVATFAHKELGVEATDNVVELIVEQFVRIRNAHDFPFWAATLVYIKDKNPGRPDCLFRLNYPQRGYVALLEKMRLADVPIRICMLKARQWGGSTCTQLYMAWLQLIHRPNLNSLIIAHVNTASSKIKAMFQKMLDRYPVRMLHKMGEAYKATEKKLVWEGNSDTTQRVPQRGCTISIGSSESPTSSRGGDYSLVHLSEIGLFTDSEKIRPAALIRSATSGVLYKPYTMIVYESTADGIGTFFHGEYTAAAKGRSQFTAFFVPWFSIENYRLPFANEKERRAFASELLKNKDNANVASNREEPGRYLYWLWGLGATLEGIHWYVSERTKYTDHGQMAAEFPSNDIEAFVNAGSTVFDPLLVEKLRATCRPPRFVGDVYGDGDEGKAALQNLRFSEDGRGLLWIWAKPDISPDERVKNRYLVVVDVGGRSSKADWSVIVVFDRLFMMDGGRPSVVAQWYGHIDIDLLAWKAAQVAAYYDNALLVIESNTLETHDKERQVDGDQSLYILNQIVGVYPNLYARRQSEEDIRQGAPRKWGFHTNVATKPMIISNLVKVVRDALYTERDARCLNEMEVYERKPNGAFGAVTNAHDDLLMTRAIGLHICMNEMAIPTIVPRNDERLKAMSPQAVSAATI